MYSTDFVLTVARDRQVALERQAAVHRLIRGARRPTERGSRRNGASPATDTSLSVSQSVAVDACLA